MADPAQTHARLQLSNVSDAERALALQRFQIIRPFLEDQMPLPEVALKAGISLRAARYGVKRYQQGGLVALGRKIRFDRDKPQLCSNVQQFIEGLALQKPRLSVATIHRKVIETAGKLAEPAPSYTVVYRLIRKLEPALMTMAHEGSKAYSDSFDLVHRREAAGPNTIWQADHSELDIWLIREDGKLKKHWLTIVFDDYSRAVAGYFLFFEAPSAIQTALALRQASCTALLALPCRSLLNQPVGHFKG
jgi:putative transposase